MTRPLETRMATPLVQEHQAGPTASTASSCPSSPRSARRLCTKRQLVSCAAFLLAGLLGGCLVAGITAVARVPRQNTRDVLFHRIADYAGRHLQHVTNDHNDTHCRADEKKPYALTSCPSHRYLNVTGFDRRSDANIEFCLASAFGAPDSVGAPPQCRWDDINDISEEMGWADAAVYNPNWQDNCSGIRANGTYAEYCDCLEETDSYWFKAYRDNLRKYCHDKFLIVIHKMNGDIGFSQKCEVRWMIRNIGSEVKCPIVGWNFDQLWEFRSAVCSARLGGNPREDLEGLFVAGGRQTEEMIVDQLGADQSSPDYKQYMSFLSGSQASCWKS